MDEHGPAGRADQPGDGHAAAVGPQPVSALAAPHPVGRAAAVELRAALAQAQHRAVPQVEGERARLAHRPGAAGRAGHPCASTRIVSGSAVHGHRAFAAERPTGLGHRGEASRSARPVGPVSMTPSAGIGRGRPSSSGDHADPDDRRRRGARELDRPSRDRSGSSCGAPAVAPKSEWCRRRDLSGRPARDRHARRKARPPPSRTPGKPACAEIADPIRPGPWTHPSRGQTRASVPTVAQQASSFLGVSA